MIGYRVVQFVAHLLCRYFSNSNHLPATCMAGGNSNGRTRNLQKICEEFNAGFVGLAVNWRSGKGKFERVSHFASDGILLRAWVNFDGENYSCRRFLN